MQYLLQAGPQGLIRIWPTALSEEMNYCSFMVNMTTTSAEIIKLVFEKYELVDDPRRYYVCEMGLGKGGRPLEILSQFVLFFPWFEMWIGKKNKENFKYVTTLVRGVIFSFK